MKFSASFVVLAFTLAKITIALPVGPDVFDLAERDSADSYDLEARNSYGNGNLYGERSIDDNELSERDLAYDDFEARDLNARAKTPSPAPKPAPAPASKPAPKPAPNSPVNQPKPPAGRPNKPPAGQPNKPPTGQPNKPPANQPKPKPGGQCKRPGPTRGGKKRSFVARTTPGQSITVGGKQYKLGEDVSGRGGQLTFKVEGGKAFAKRPQRTGKADQDFTTEISNTKKASDALDSGLFIAEGTDGGYEWLITGAMPGGELAERWFNDQAKFASKRACEDDMKDAVAAVKAAQQKLASGAGFVHADSHPGNWFVPTSGKITSAVPIDLGRTMPANTNIDKLLSDQYKYPADHWATYAECNFCV